MDKERLDIETMILPDGTPAKEGIKNLRFVLLEHFENDILDLKICLGIHISQETAETVVKDAVRDILGEDVEIDGNESFKVASKDNNTLVFYIFNPFGEDCIIWERQEDEDEE